MTDAERIKVLENRCYILSQGALCVFCKFHDCQYSNKESKEEQPKKKRERKWMR